MKRFSFFLFLSFIFSGSVFANTGNYPGTNVGGIPWTRPFADGTCCSSLGPVDYHVEQFTISSNDTCNISSVQNGWDGYLFVYRDPFDPTNQTNNFVAGDDDGNGGITTSDIVGVALTANTVYRVVTTGFANGEVGTFTNSVACPSATVTIGPPPAPVPTLSEWAMITFAMLIAGFGIYQQRRRQS